MRRHVLAAMAPLCLTACGSRAWDCYEARACPGEIGGSGGSSGQPDANQDADAATGTDGAVVMPDGTATTPDQLSVMDTGVPTVDGSVRDAGSDGSTATPDIFISTEGVPRGIALSDTHVYWVELFPPRLLRAPKDNGTNVERLDVPADGVVAPFDVGVNGTHLAWTEASGSICYKPLSGETGACLQPVFKTAGYVAMAPGAIYSTDYNPNSVAQMGFVVATVPGARTPKPVYDNQPRAAGVAIVGDVLYWAHSSASGLAGIAKGSILSAPSEEVLPADVAMVGATIDGLAIDSTHLYWILNDQRLMKTPLPYGPSRLVHDAGHALGGASDVAVDERFIYFSARTDRKIYRVSKAL